MRTFVEWVVRRRRLVVAGTFLVTCVLLLQLRRLEMIIDTDRILPQTHPYIVATNLVEQYFGSRITVLVGLTARNGDVLNEAMLRKLKGVTDALANTRGAVKGNTRSLASPQVKDIVGDEEGLSARAMMPVVPATPAAIEDLRRAILNNPIYDGVLISHDRRSIAVITDFQRDPDGFDAINQRVEAAIAPYKDDTVDIAITGQLSYLAALERYSGRMIFLLPMAILVIGVLHFEAFRTVQSLILPLVTALLSVVWGLGLMMLLGIHEIDPFSNITPILIIAVAAGHAVQILKRYYEAFHRSGEVGGTDEEANEQAVIEAVSAIGPVMVAAGGIAAASFLSLLVFDVQSIRTFGLFAATGILSALVIELTFIPAVRAMLRPPRRAEFRRERKPTLWDRVVAASAESVIAESSRRSIIVGSVVAAIFMGVGAARIVNDNSLRGFFTADQPFVLADNAINEHLAGANTLFLLIEGPAEDSITSPAVLNGMLATQEFLRKEPQIGATLSIANHVARMNRAMHGNDPAEERIPESQDLVAQYLLLYSMSGSAGDFRDLVDPGYSRAVIQAFVRTDSSAYMSDIGRRLGGFLSTAFPPGIRIRLAGSITTPSALSELVVRGKLLNIAQVAAVVFVAGTLLFRSAVAGLLLLIPLAMVALANFGMMGWMGIPLQIATATVAALAIGVGADYAIYFTYRLRDELRAERDIETAMRRAYATAGKASLYVASAVGGGFAVLTLSYGFRVHAWLGVMIGLAMFVSVLSALLLYPALILALRPSFIFDPDEGADSEAEGLCSENP